MWEKSFSVLNLWKVLKANEEAQEGMNRNALKYTNQIQDWREGELMTKVLIVEDERIVAEDILNRLHILGYTVAGVASTGEEALEKVRKQQPDLVLMDIVLKGDMDGTTTAELIRDHSDIPVIFVTAYTTKEILEKSKTEPYRYVVKPFGDTEIRTAIEKALFIHKKEKEGSQCL